MVANIIEEKVLELLETRMKTPDVNQDMEIKRNFLFKHLTKIIHYEDDTFTLYGTTNKSDFKVQSSITNADRHKKRPGK